MTNNVSSNLSGSELTGSELTKYLLDKGHYVLCAVDSLGDREHFYTLGSYYVIISYDHNGFKTTENNYWKYAVPVQIINGFSPLKWVDNGG